MPKKANTNEDPVQRELIDIKRLLMLQLLRDGASQSELAAALRVSQPSVSRMFPGGIGGATKPSKTSKR